MRKLGVTRQARFISYKARNGELRCILHFYLRLLPVQLKPFGLAYIFGNPYIRKEKALRFCNL